MSDVLVERGGEDVVMGGVKMGCVNRRLYHYRMFRCLYREDCWSVVVRLPLDAIAKMGGDPSRQAGLELEWLDGEGVQPVGTNTFRSMLHGSSFVGSHIDQCGLKVCLEKGDGDSQP